MNKCIKLFVIMFSLSVLAGCSVNKNPGDIPEGDLGNQEGGEWSTEKNMITEANDVSGFKAKVLQVEPDILVEPCEGEWELNSADQIYVRGDAISEEVKAELKAGDIILVNYTGEIMETYPAQITAYGIEILEQSENNIAEYGYAYANIRLELPDDWSFRIVEKDETKEGYEDKFGIDFYPDEAPEHVYHFYYHVYPFGMCGTGVEFETIELQNGSSVEKCTEKFLKDEKNNRLGMYLTLVFLDTQGSYIIECEDYMDVFEKYDSELLEILETVEIGTKSGNLSREEATDIARSALEAEDEYFGVRFEYLEGVWRVYSLKENKTAKIDLEGNVVEIYEGDLYAE